MGLTCSKWSAIDETHVDNGGLNSPSTSRSAPSSLLIASGSSKKNNKGDSLVDPFMHDLMKRSIDYYTTGECQEHQTLNANTTTSQAATSKYCSNSSSRGSKSGSNNSSTGSNRQNKKSSKSRKGRGGRRDNDENAVTQNWMEQGQYHLLFNKRQSKASSVVGAALSNSSASGGSINYHSSSGTKKIVMSPSTMVHYPTRLVVRRRTVRSSLEEGASGTHIYAIRFPLDQPLKREMTQEQYPRPSAASQGPSSSAAHALLSSNNKLMPVTTNHRMVQSKLMLLENHHPNTHNSNSNNQSHHALTVHSKSVPSAPTGASAAGVTHISASNSVSSSSESSLQAIQVDQLFTRKALLAEPKYRVSEWVTVSSEHRVYIVDTGLSALDCDELIEITEQVCRGQYAAYTYAKQTLGCREFPALAWAAQDVVHSVVHAIYEKFAHENATRLLLDDREPHIVKYDVSKKERQKLDMHTDKSEWTFLIALSNGCGLDYDGGGTYFECLDSTIHVQRGQALIFPGKLRHCGQRIASGLRFLLVGFLVDKTASGKVVGGSGAGSITGIPLSPDLDPALLAHVANIP